MTQARIFNSINFIPANTKRYLAITLIALFASLSFPSISNANAARPAKNATSQSKRKKFAKRMYKRFNPFRKNAEFLQRVASTGASGTVISSATLVTGLAMTNHQMVIAAGVALPSSALVWLGANVLHTTSNMFNP